MGQTSTNNIVPDGNVLLPESTLNEHKKEQKHINDVEWKYVSYL